MGEITIRGELLNDLLRKRVTYSDVKKHQINEEELRILYGSDSINVKEFMHMYKRDNPCAHLRSGYVQWDRELKRKVKLLAKGDVNDFSHVISCSIQYGIDKELLIGRLQDKEIPTYWYFSSEGMYIRELLRSRDFLYECMISVEEVAHLLDMSSRQFRRIAKQSGLKISNGKVSILEISNFLWDRISRECEILMNILPERLENYVKGWKSRIAIMDNRSELDVRKSQQC